MRQLIGLLHIVLLAAAMAAAADAAVQQPADPFDACARETDAAARLACFDQAVRHRHAPRPAHDGSGQSSAAADRTSTATDRSSARAGHAPVGGDHDSAAVRVPDGPIVAHVARFEYHADHRYIFDLDNGQVWEQVESQPGLFIHPHETIRITHGAFGSFFLQTSSHRLTRVQRLR